MPSEWPEVRLEEVTTILGDGLHGTPEYDDHGAYYFINGNNLSNGQIVFNEKTRRVSVAEYQRHRKDLNDRTILVSINGTLGNVALYRGERVVLGKSACYFNVRPGVDKHFVRYVMDAPTFQDYIHTLATGSTIKNVSLRLMRDFVFQLPPLGQQREISTTLSALDDRIALLRETNATLEAIAQALFKSWFVDFDPVRAKAEGRDPVGVPPEVADLFPSEFEDSELGEIPKAWRVKPFADTVEILGGGTPKTSVPEYWDGNIPWFSVVDAPALGQVFTVATEKAVTELGIQNSSARVLPAWTTVISARGTVGKLALTGVEMAMNQSCYGLRSKAKGGEVLAYLAAQRLVDTLKRLAHGGVFDTITRATLASVNVCEVPGPLVTAFGAVVNPIFRRILANNLQVQSLTELRDTLLPRLMSGKLRIPDTQEAMEEATA